MASSRWVTKGTRLLLLAVLAMLSALGLVSSRSDRTAAQDPTPRPNIVLIVTDDQRRDTLRYMPSVQRNLRGAGVTLSIATAETPLCCPSRASILTGKYTHNHGIWWQGLPDGGATLFRDNGGDRSTVATWLQDAGYTTSYVGKYLNQYNPIAPYIPPGWDDWYVFQRGGPYYDYVLNIGGTSKRFGTDPSSYSTDVFARHAVEFIQSTQTPFFLVFAPHAPHKNRGEPPTVAARHRGTCDALTFSKPPSFNEEDTTDKPARFRSTPVLTADQIAFVEAVQRSTACSLKAVDEAVGAIVRALGDRLGNTVILLTSDNGFTWGEHRLITKNVPYEESIRVPLVVRAPMFGATARLDPTLVQNIDLPVTIAALAGATVPDDVDGVSLVPLLRGEAVTPRDAALIEMYRGDRPPDVAVRTRRYKYVKLGTGEEELYDLQQDPYELTNQVANPAYARTVASLRTRLAALQAS